MAQAASGPDRPRRIRSDAPFFVILSVIGLTYVLLILAMLAADDQADLLEQALAGEPIRWPVYLVYDWFVQNRAAPWPELFAQGLGELKHADLVRVERPLAALPEVARRCAASTASAR